MYKKMTGLITAGVLLLSTVNLTALGENALHKAVIKNLKNRVELKYGSSMWRVASMNQLVRPGTSIRTGALSRAELLYPDGTITRVGSRTSLTVLDKSFRAVRVDSGKMWFRVTKKSGGLKIYSPTAVAAITGTEGFAQFGQVEDDEKSSINPSSTRLASGDKSSFKVAETVNNDFSFGLAEGSADVFKSDVAGEPTGNPITVNAGELLSFSNGTFNLQNVGVDVIMNQNRDINEPDETAGNNGNAPELNSADPGNEDLGPSNVATDNVPNSLNDSQDLNTSPTTGDLEIIIK